ncbi:hypothetical protein [Lacticaseibacillus mingshuiensis]|uniref:hypothetical protein n=1 Tax=Lacticaseibacillus mingshuiensis TaxID=2799574 RepID=UPI00194ED8D1|nr:hypothetical protein [Lacticaseibacillus mingshuiensis]
MEVIDLRERKKMPNPGPVETQRAAYRRQGYRPKEHIELRAVDIAKMYNRSQSTVSNWRHGKGVGVREPLQFHGPGNGTVDLAYFQEWYERNTPDRR